MSSSFVIGNKDSFETVTHSKSIRSSSSSNLPDVLGKKINNQNNINGSFNT